jgi:hypothetical protein
LHKIGSPVSCSRYTSLQLFMPIQRSGLVYLKVRSYFKSVALYQQFIYVYLL